MTINKLLTPYNYTNGELSRIKFLVIHYVGATGNAKANCEYYASKYIGASAHYFVNFDGTIWQSVEDKNIAWHCGGKKYANTIGGAYYGICTNANSIGVEMCVRKKSDGTWYFEDTTVESAIALIKTLMTKYNIPAENVIRHFDVTGKNCPAPYVSNNTNHTWNDFKKALIAEKKYDIGWKNDENGWWYANTETSYYQSEWAIINGHKYYFNDHGYAVKDWQLIDGNWYYFEPRENHDLECALYVSDTNGVQTHGIF